MFVKNALECKTRDKIGCFHLYPILLMTTAMGQAGVIKSQIDKFLFQTKLYHFKIVFDERWSLPSNHCSRGRSNQCVLPFMAAALFMHIFTMSSSEWNTLKVQLFNKKQTLEIYSYTIYSSWKRTYRRYMKIFFLAKSK